MALSGRMRADFPGLTPAQLYAIAADIEAYPTFIPWCRAARIVERADGIWRVENHFGAGPVDVTFTSLARPAPPDRLEITSTDGPFRDFRLAWRFAPIETGGARAIAEYRLALKSPLLQGLAALSMGEVERRVEHNFRARAKAVYMA
ncbi:MAG: type II toxin-antitoxin system RatA family toxin [Alphaproteobacteria bacterium]|nr:type II toxin-antitoxin system RatA family toxin [Alphaproteobacteria bacterium]